MLNPPSQLSDEELARRRRELREIKFHRLGNEPHRLYVPIGKFEEFINIVGSGKYISTLFEAANGVGKTLGMINLLANLFWPVENRFFQQELLLNWPFEKRGRIISDPNTIIETIIPELKEAFPKGRYNIEKYETSKDGKRYESHWHTDTGWDFTLMTYEQDVKEFESATLGFVWMDEPPPEPIYKANIARLRMGGIAMITETPLSGSQWLFDEFIDKAPDILEAQKKAVIQAELEDACEDHGVNGFITHQRIVDQISQYDEDDMQARVFGKHQHLTGLIFKKWNKSVHIIKPFQISYKDYVVVQALDPHPRVNDAVLWVAIDRMGRSFIVDELWGNFELEELAQRIKGIDKQYRVVKWLIDPSAFVVDKHTGHSLASDLLEYDLEYEPGSKARTDAIRLIRDKINYQYVNGEWVTQPKLLSFDTCFRANWEMGHWQWENWQGKTATYKSLKEKPVDRDDHMIENLGRILIENIEFEEVPKEEYNYSESGIIIGQEQAKKLDPYE